MPQPKEAPKRARGRPVGSLSKRTLKEAVKRFEANQLEAAQLLIDVMNNNVEGEDISIKERVGAARYIITAPATMRKGLQETEGTIDKQDAEESGITIVPDEVLGEVVPLVQMNITNPTFKAQADKELEELKNYEDSQL